MTTDDYGRMMQTIVFDFGNVIGFFDYQRTLRRLGAHTALTPAQMEAAVYGTTLEDEYGSGRMSSPDFLAELHRLWGLRCDQAETAAAFADIFTPNHEVCALVPLLAGRYRLLLGSNTNDLHARHFRRQFADTLRHFHSLVLSHEIGVCKPHADFFLHCEHLAACAPEACLFIDDLPENVAGARACGWHGLVYRDPQELRSSL